jgi:CRP/FNR family cyclic AMP-dependent transcriptional regulator
MLPNDREIPQSRGRQNAPILQLRRSVITLRLATMRPFSRLPAAEVERLQVAGKIRQYAKGETLFEAGDTSDHVYVVVEGRIRLGHLRADGSVRAVCIMQSADTFCCLPAMDGGPYPVSATASVDTTALELPGALFRDLIQNHPEFSAAALSQFCGRIRDAACESCAVIDEVPARLASRLLQLDRQFPGDIPLTRREIGELAGTTVETTIRCLKEFEGYGWVALGRSNVRVLDAAALERRAAGEFGPDPRAR